MKKLNGLKVSYDVGHVGTKKGADVRRRRFGIALATMAGLALPMVPTTAKASCNGCTAHWSIEQQSGGKSGIRWNSSSETLSQQDFHGSLFDGCDYSGTQLFNMNHVYYNTATFSQWGTPQYSKSQLTWAGGHHWNDGVTDYGVTVADTQFGC
jgi:hypothetical protein